MSYQVWIFLHICGVIVFFANGVAALLWRGRAERSHDPRIIAFAYETLNAGDRWLTPASVAVTVGSGVGAASVAGLPILSTGWIAGSIVSFTLAGLIFLFRVGPLQKKLAEDAARSALQGGFDYELHEHQAVRWSFWAHASLLSALVSVPLMVFKPGAGL